MKTKFYVTFAAEFGPGPLGKRVTRIRAENLTQTPPSNRIGVPVEFNVDLPESLFMGRQVSIDITIPEPSAAAPTVEATPGSPWAEALKRAGVE